MRKEKHVFFGGVFSKRWKLAAKVSESVFGLDLQIGSAPNIKFKATKHGLCPLKSLACISGRVGGRRDSRAAEVPCLSEDPHDRAAYIGYRL